MTNYFWTYSVNGGATSSAGSASTAGIPIPNVSGSVVVNLTTANSNGCVNTCHVTNTIVPPADCIASLNPPSCPGTTQTNQLNVTPAPGSTIQWTISSPCGASI